MRQGDIMRLFFFFILLNAQGYYVKRIIHEFPLCDLQKKIRTVLYMKNIVSFFSAI